MFVGYFKDKNPEALLQELNEIRESILVAGLSLPQEPIRIEEVIEEDWHAGWKKYFKPIVISDRLVVRPPWEAFELTEGMKEIVLEPKQSFGTGNHESTRLMLKYIAERGESLPRRALDAGTGSGILSIAHLLFRPDSEIEAFDVDEICIVDAKEYAREHGFASQIHLTASTTADYPTTKSFPLIYANLQKHIIEPDLPHFVKLLAPGGNFIMSGLLAAEGERMVTALEPFPLEVIHREALGEWIRIDCRSTEV